MKFLIEYFNSNSGNKEIMKIEANDVEEAIEIWQEKTDYQFARYQISEFKPLSIMPKPIDNDLSKV